MTRGHTLPITVKPQAPNGMRTGSEVDVASAQSSSFGLKRSTVGPTCPHMDNASGALRLRFLRGSLQHSAYP
jgi:hypothetical protein